MVHKLADDDHGQSIDDNRSESRSETAGKALVTRREFVQLGAAAAAVGVGTGTGLTATSSSSNSQNFATGFSEYA